MLQARIDDGEWPDRWVGHAGETTPSLLAAAEAALRACELDRKVAITRQAAAAWARGELPLGRGVGHRLPDRPGRPERPALVPPGKVRKRSLHSERGRIALLHAIAHIELNAMDLAWDVIGRFADHRSGAQGRPMPRSFYDGWVRVAYEEAKHFSLLRDRLQSMGADYGDLDAHDGLWEASRATAHGLTARLAVVPLILEARGLDVTPGLIERISETGDEQSARIFQIIYRDEQGHVAVGAKWFRYLCLREGREPAAAFQDLVRRHFRGGLKPPFNDMARARAGLTPGFYRALSSAGT